MNSYPLDQVGEASDGWMGLEVVGLALSQLLQCFDWSFECRNGVHEDLDMSEAYGMTMPQ